jgi:hypothetical protein
VPPWKIEDLGMTEPYLLEKWVTTYSAALGSDVLIVASEYDRWISPSGVDGCYKRRLRTG